MTAFVQSLDAESLKVFTKVTERTFAEQGQFLLNAFWSELEGESEFIYNVSYEQIKKVDMDNKGISYIHLYQEGSSLDFDMTLRLFEVVRYYFEDKKNAAMAQKHAMSRPADMTAISRKREIKEKVDVDHDGRISFLEYLLYVYNLSPKDLLDRSKGSGEAPEVTAAKSALAEVQKKINEYEALKLKLTLESEQPGVKGLKAKNELAQLNSSPLAEELRRLLITAEAAVRKAIRLYGGAAGTGAAPTQGTMFWLQADLDAKKKKYGGAK